MSIQEKIKQGEVVLIDGGTGTELEKRGVPMKKLAWSSMATLTHTDLLQEIHEDYLNEGVDLIIANSYSCSKHLLEGAGVGEHFEALNKTAVSAARAACDNVGRRPLIAGSISTTHMFTGLPDIGVAYRNYIEQAQILKDEGCDLIILEMMREISHTLAALKAIQKTGLPVWLGLSCVIKEGVPYLFDETVTLETGMKVFKDLDVEAICIMHTLTQDVDASLDVVQKYWDGTLGVYAHSGEFIEPSWSFMDQITPDDYADNCERWLGRGVTIIGGCCGIEPKHIAELRKRLGRE